MREILIVGLIVVALIGGWFVISSTTNSNSSQVSDREKILAREMQQLIDFYDSAPVTPAMPNHKIRMLDDGTGVFLHFDAAYGQETKLMWIGQLVPGRFCAGDQQAIEAEYGPNFTHFHKTSTPGNDPAAGHGGVGGEEGYWFRHISVGSIPQGEMGVSGVPWGPVSPGIDANFMPTVAPEC